VYHEFGGHGFNSEIAGNEDPNIVAKLQNLKQQGVSDRDIYNAAISYVQSTKPMTRKEASDIAFGYMFAAKYPKIYKMQKYNYDLG
jgi:hypothetical protein